MSPTGVPDDQLPDFDQEQLALALGSEGFEALAELAKARVLTPTSFSPEKLGELTYDEYELLAGTFGAINRSCSWWIGDLLNAAEDVHGETFAQIAFRTGLSEQTLLNRKYVCAHVPPDRRVPTLSFSLHAKVAPLTAKEQRYWLGRAEKGNWTVDMLVEHMRAKRKTEKPPIPGAGDPEPGSLMEVAYAILRDAVPAEDDRHHLIPNEDLVRLRAALGEEEDPTDG